MPLVRLLIVSASLLSLSCADDTGKRAVDPDRGADAPADQPALVQVTCKPDRSDCRDFVVSQLLLPTSTAEVDAWALRLDGGQRLNALGNILTALASLGPTANLQGAVDDMFYQGDAIVLARLRASDFENDESAAGQTWVGAPASCCPDASGDPARCKQEALQDCFGDPPHAFPVDPSVTQSSLLGGSLHAGALSLTAPSLRLALPLPGAGVMELTVRSAQLRGELSAAGIRQGALAGAIPQSEVQDTLIPHVAQMLEAMLNDPASSGDVKDLLGTVFDRDKDGHITAVEVKESSIKSLLEGDVDTDHDGEKELSLGLGFEAVPAVIAGK